MTNKFTTVLGATPLELNTHNATITINSQSQLMEALVVICYESNSLLTAGNNAFVRRELYMYWDDSAPEIVMNITPSRINDWNKRYSVFIEINTSNDNSMCALNLSASKIIDNSNGWQESLNYSGIDSIPLDTGATDVFNSYNMYRNYTYNLPSRWLSDLNLNATYEFNVNCWNRAQLQSFDNQSVLYDLDKKIMINLTSANVINGSSIPVSFVTNINSSCSATINDTAPTITIPTTTIDGIHHYANLSSSTQLITGTHIIVIKCIVPNNANIAAGIYAYSVTLDATPPSVNLSTIDNSNYVCNLNGFDINVNMVDDTGIAGYVYTITGAGVNTNSSYGQVQNGMLDNQLSISSGLVTRTGIIHYSGTLVENSKYTISAQATDLAGKVSNPWTTIQVTAETANGSIECDNYPPVGAITLAPTQFLDRIQATVTCTDADDFDTGCNPAYLYSFTTNSNCSGQSYSTRGVLGTALIFNSSGLLCVKVSDPAGRNDWVDQYINISIDMSNPFNIRPASNMNYIYPNVIVTKVPITDISVNTDVAAECRYSKMLIGNGTSSLANLFSQYMPFTTSFSTTHTISQFDTNGLYDQYIDIVCMSNALASSNYSRRVLRIIYTNDIPSLAASVDPQLVYDWNNRQSILSIDTTPATTCIVTSNDAVNTPNKIYLGNHSNADTYMPEYINNFIYSPNTPSGVFVYNINCSTMADNYAQTKVYVTYNISSSLNITIANTLYNTNTIELLINTSLISDCKLMWNNNYKGSLIKNTAETQHSIVLNNISDGQYIAEFTCITPITRINKTQDFIITVDTTTPPNMPPQASITLSNTTFLDVMKAYVSCTDADDGCEPTYYYILTNNTNTNCSKIAYNNANTGTLGGNPIQIFKDALLCVQVRDKSGQKGYAQAYVDIPIDVNNPFNITPIQTNYIQPNVYIANTNPTNIIVTTNINANCKYSLNAPSSYETLTNQQLYDNYIPFDATGAKIHTINSISLPSYEQYLDIICYSTELATTNFSRKTLRVIYNTMSPTMQANTDPTLVYDWNARFSYLNINTTPETVCTITSNDINNQPYQLGIATDATTYDVMHVKKLLYTNLSATDIILYYYNISCRTLNGNTSNAIVNVLYNISQNLTIILNSPQIFSTKNITIEADTNLISNCKVRLNNSNQTSMINNIGQKIHSINMNNVNDGIYIAEIACITPYTNYYNTLTFNITVNTSLAVPRCGDGIINTPNTDCDGNTSSGLNDQTCESLFNGNKYVGGELACDNNCKYDYSQCDDGHGYCGDNKVEGPNTLGIHEQCDDSVPSSLSCNMLGFQGGKLTCNDNCMLNTSRCVDTSTTGTTTAPTCNGLLLQSGEQCEDTFFNASYIMCQDFGYDRGTVSCNSCAFDLSNCYIDVTSTHSHRCGNNVKEGDTEQCDGTSGMDSITCKTLDFTGGNISCGSDCQYNTTQCINNTNNNPTSNACSNGVKDLTETDIDCGGSCTSCGLNKNCIINDDCTSGICSNGKCSLNSCSNNIFDAGSETDIDCGKTCNPCELDKNCSVNTDCKSDFCSNGKCSTDPCSNGVLDAGESDIDCGGNCSTCTVGKACNGNLDCDSGVCYNNICIESGTEPNPVKIPLMIIGAVMMLAGGGYIIYKTFIAKPPKGPNTGYGGQFANGFGQGTNHSMPPSMPIILTPEQKEIVKKQHEAMIKKRQGRLEERKGVLQQLGESTAAEKNKDAPKDESSKSSNKESSNENEEFIDLSKIKNSKDDNSKKDTKEDNAKDTFDKLKALSIDKTSKKIAQMSGTTQENITPALTSTNDLSDADAIKLFGEMDRDTLMSGVFKEVLSDLMHSKKLTKENASRILFEYMDKGLLSKGDVAKISSELKII